MKGFCYHKKEKKYVSYAGKNPPKPECCVARIWDSLPSSLCTVGQRLDSGEDEIRAFTVGKEEERKEGMWEKRVRGERQVLDQG